MCQDTQDLRYWQAFDKVQNRNGSKENMTMSLGAKQKLI